MEDLSAEHTLGGAGTERGEWALDEGDILAGYRVIRPLGRGGMGEVYLVEHELMGMHCALKLLSGELAGDGEFRERFRREARLMAWLDHPGIVRVNYMAEEHDRLFLVMEYVEGPDGAPRNLDAALGEEGRLREGEARYLVLELCDALRYAHGRGVVHRDIKPSNILIDREGRAKLSDFGLARIAGDGFFKSLAERSASLSAARTDGGGALSRSDNAILGTYDYMSPEQKAGGPVDARSDIYSLGLVIYRIVTGRRAQGVLTKPTGWEAVVQRCLAPEPERRYASVEELMRDVRPARASRPAPAAKVGPVAPAEEREPKAKPAARARPRLRWRPGCVLALVVALVLPGLVMLVGRRRREPAVTGQEMGAVRAWLVGVFGAKSLSLKDVSAADLEKEKRRLDVEHEKAVTELEKARHMLAAVRRARPAGVSGETNYDVKMRREREARECARAEAVLAKKLIVVGELLRTKRGVGTLWGPASKVDAADVESLIVASLEDARRAAEAERREQVDELDRLKKEAARLKSEIERLKKERRGAE